jgi:hypothetical protein
MKDRRRGELQQMASSEEFGPDGGRALGLG